MTNNRKVRVAAVALVAVMLASAALLTSCKKAASPTTPGAGASSTTTSTTSTGTGTPSTQGQTTTVPTATANGAPGSTPGATETTSPDSPIGPFAELPDPKLPARTVKTPIAAGKKLPPLASAPADTISALKLGTVPNGAAYFVTLRPYGIGPSILLGSRLAVLIDAATPKSGAPSYSKIVGANVLVLVDTKHGGTITKGGTYSAWLVFQSDGSKLLPVMSRASLVK